MSNIATISKSFTISSGHRLMLHPGKCQNLHGHTYGISIELTGKVSAETGMVVDFAEFSHVKRDLLDILDHGLILNPADLDVIELCLKRNWKHYLMPVEYPEPTAENIARLVLAFAVEFYTNYLSTTYGISEYGITEVSVTVAETPNTIARVTSGTIDSK